MASTIDESLAQMALENGCTEISLDESSAFAAIWVFSVLTSLMLFLMSTFPYCMCTKETRSDAHEQTHSDDAESSGGSAAAARQSQTPADLMIDPEPNREKARLYLWQNSATDRDMGEHKWRSVWSTPIHELTKCGGGIGTELYFRLLRSLGFCFCFMAAMTSPIVAFNTRGNFAPDSGNNLVKTTVGNIGSLFVNSTLSPPQRYVIVNCQAIAVSALTQYLGALDVLAAGLFLAFVCYVRFIQIPRCESEDNVANITPQDFTVRIDYLPRKLGDDHTDYEKLLATFVQERLEDARKKTSGGSAPAKVQEVALVRDYDQKFSAVLKLSKLKEKRVIAEYKKDEKTLGKLESKITKFQDKLSKHLKADDLAVIRAYVILDTEKDAEDLLNHYRLWNFPLLRCCQGRRKFRGKGIRIQRAAEPSDIIWQNQDLEWHWRLLRKCLSFLFVFILITISLSVIYGLGQAARQESKTTIPALGFDNCDAFLDDSSDDPVCDAAGVLQWTPAEATAMGGSDLECWCASQGVQKVLEDSSIQDACSAWIEDTGRASAILGMSSLSVVVINVIVEMVLIAMASFESPLSMSSLRLSMMIKVAAAQTLNTSLIVTMLDWNAPQWIKDLSLVIPVGGQLLFRGKFGDTVRGWYSVVGASIMLNMVLNAWVPNIAKIGKMILAAVKRRVLGRRAKHQLELIELYTPLEFEISTNFAKMLVTVYCCMMYSSGMPVLYLIGAMYMFVTYWTDKVVLLWGCKRPPSYNTKMAKTASTMMLYACFLHCMIAVIMLGQPCVFPSESLGGSMTSVIQDAEASAEDANEDPSTLEIAFKQIGKESTWLHFVMMAVLAALWSLWLVTWLFASSVGPILSALKHCCCRRKVSPSDSGAVTWEGIKDTIEKRMPPASYQMKNNPNFIRFAKVFEGTDVDASAGEGADASPGANASAAGGAVSSGADVSADGGAAATEEQQASGRSGGTVS